MMSMDEATQLRRKKMMPKFRKTMSANTGITVLTKGSRLSTNTFVAYRTLDRKVALAIRDLAGREERAWRKEMAREG